MARSPQSQRRPAGGFCPGRDHSPIWLAKKPVDKIQVKYGRVYEGEARVDARSHLQAAATKQMPGTNGIGLPFRISKKNAAAEGGLLYKKAGEMMKKADIRINIKTKAWFRENDIKKFQPPHGSLPKSKRIGMASQMFIHTLICQPAIKDPQTGEMHGKAITVL